jgi:nicotinate-nucleotide--dimethylbenzimidazole phosphoribosyltransferase
MSLDETLRLITPLDRSTEAAAQQCLNSLTKPRGSLGILEELARRVAVIQGNVPPSLGRKLLYVFAADHGITEEGVSAYPKEVTAQMTRNFLNGGAAINVLGRHCGVDVKVVDVGVDFDFGSLPGLRDAKVRRGTANFAKGAAMSRAEALRAVEVGIESARQTEKTRFLVGAGDMGIGNTSSAAAICCALMDSAPAAITGLGTGIDDATLKRKIAAIEKGLRLNRPETADPIDVLAKVGGLEIGAITGLILGGAACRVPVVLDGFIAASAALLAVRLSPAVRDFLFASHLSAEKGHRMVLQDLQLCPVLDLNMRLGEGTGACLAMNLIEAGVKIMSEMATFESAGVREKGT